MYETRSVLNTVLFQLSNVQRQVQQRYTEALADLGVRPVQVYALAVLKDQKLSMPSEIATILGVSRPTVTNLLDRMERDGLVQRVVDRVNRKQRWIVPTDKGIELMTAATEKLRQVERTVWAEDSEGLDAFREQLGKAQKTLDKADQNAE